MERGQCGRWGGEGGEGGAATEHYSSLSFREELLVVGGKGKHVGGEGGGYGSMWAGVV